MRRAGRVALACLALVRVACDNDQPDESRPWVVVVDEASTRAMAEKRAEVYAEEHPEHLKGASALSIEDQGMVRHLVVSKGHEQREEAAGLARAVPGGRELRVIDVTTQSRASDGTLEITAPEGAEHIEHLAALLPDPGGGRLRSFLLLADPQTWAEASLRPFGFASPREFFFAFANLGFGGVAEAAYLPANTRTDDAPVLVFAGVPAAAASTDPLKQLYNFLLERTAPGEEELEKLKKERKRRRRRRRRGRKRRGPEPAIEWQELPAAAPRAMPWGPGEIHVVERMTFVKRDRFKDTTRQMTAWIAWGPGKKAVLLVMFDPTQEASASRLLQPNLLGEPRGLSFHPAVARVWRSIPEVSVEGEKLAYVGMDRLENRLDRKRRRSDWASRLADRPVQVAAYSTAGSSWQVSWVDLGSVPDAQVVYDEAYVTPRTEMIQKTVLKSRRGVHYEVGVTLHEVGDTQGWFLKGAERGRLQELYFRKDSAVWLLRTPHKGKPPLALEDVLARTELLQLWDEPAE